MVLADEVGGGAFAGTIEDATAAIAYEPAAIFPIARKDTSRNRHAPRRYAAADVADARPARLRTGAVQRATATVPDFPAVRIKGARYLARGGHAGVRSAQAALARPSRGTVATIELATTAVANSSAVGWKATGVAAGQRDAGVRGDLGTVLSRGIGTVLVCHLGVERHILRLRGVGGRGSIARGARQRVPTTGEGCQHQKDRRQATLHSRTIVHAKRSSTVASMLTQLSLLARLCRPGIIRRHAKDQAIFFKG